MITKALFLVVAIEAAIALSLLAVKLADTFWLIRLT